MKPTRTLRRTAPLLFLLACSLPLEARAEEKKQSVEEQEARALEAFRLTAPLLEKLILVNEKMRARVLQDPALKKKLTERSGGNLTEIEERVQSFPALATSVKEAGMTAREYALTTVAAFTCGLVVAMEAQGIKGDGLPPGIPAVNVAFVRKNAALLERVGKSSEALARAAGEKGLEGEPGP